MPRERLNFRRRPILCTTLYRNPMQATNFGGTFDQLFLRIFYKIFTVDASQSFLYHGAKKSKMTKNSNQGGGGPALNCLLPGIPLLQVNSRRALLNWTKLSQRFGRFFSPDSFPPPPPPLSLQLFRSHRACKCYVTAWSKCMATRSNVQIWF